MSESMGRYRVGIDVGGTFTDVVLPAADGSLHALKLLSSPDDYGRAIVAGAKELLESAGVDAAAVDELVHGTTVATNAVLEGTGAPTGLLTTRGFRDVLEMRRIRIPVQYDFAWEKPPPLVPRERRLEVDERINARGEVERPLDPRQVRRTVEQLLERGAEALACSVEHAAWGIHMVANSTMARAVKAVSTQRGRDVREFTLIAFGGSGPVHAVQLARTMGIRRVVVPFVPGLFSAAGLLMTDIEHDFAQTHLALWSDVDGATLQAVFRGLEVQAEATLRHEGLSVAEVRWRRSVDVRYRGQSHALTVAFEGGGPDSPSDVVPAFEREHELTYGHRPRGAPVELVNVRLRATVPRPRPALRACARAHTPGEARTVRFADRAVRAPVLAREMLASDATPGPILIEEYDSVIVVPPQARASLDHQGNVHVTLDHVDD